MFTTSKDQLSIQEIERYIEIFSTRDLPRLQKLKRYYDSNNDTIMHKSYEDKTKACNRVATPYCSYITSTLCGYFMGNATTYNSTDTALLDEILAVYKGNYESTKNHQLAIDASIYGVGYELIYINDNKQVAFDVLDPRTVICIYDNTIAQELKMAIRFWEQEVDILTQEKATYIEVYTADSIYYYTAGTSGTIMTGSIQHYFGKCPVNVYRNVKGFKGDFEKLIPLVDAYDNAISNTLDIREDLRDAYLLFRNTNLDDEDIQKMKEARVIQVEDSAEGSQADVSYLTKNSNDTENENLKTRIASDIERFSYISELEVKSHTSATGSSMQLIGLESLVSQKENYFRKALLNRASMIINYFNILGSNYNVADLSIIFTRNLPRDLSVEADTASKLAPYVSRETLLSNLSIVTDVKQEIARIESDNEVNSYSNMLAGE